MKGIKEKEINGFVIREEKKSGGTKKVTVEVDGKVYRVSGFNFNWLCKIAEESSKDLLNIIFN